MPELDNRTAESGVTRVAGAIEGGVRAAMRATSRELDERIQSRPRFLRRLARQPLPYLYEAHPEATHAIPHELGTETIAVDEIEGTAVGPPGARGMDFVPPSPARTPNWRDRWRRVLQAVNEMAVLPPIDVLRFKGRYWVLDGHNRVAAALYVGQLEIDANVIELVPAGEPSVADGATPGQNKRAAPPDTGR